MDSFYKELAKNKSEITFGKVFITVCSVIVFFILPCVVIGNALNSSAGSTEVQSSSEQSTKSEGRVAGVDTVQESDNIFIPILNTSLNLNSQSGLLVMFGLLLLAIALILVLYLILSRNKVKKFKY